MTSCNTCGLYPIERWPRRFGRPRASTVPLAVRLAFEFLVLTAARWGEVRWGEWTEIDRENGVWTVPARRMKSNREHRVPLCGRAVEILDEARKLVEGTSPFLFPNRLGKQLEEKQLRRMLGKHGIAAVPHGFRSSFRDWAAEETDHPREVIEAALAHMVQNKVEAAYRRTDLFERRRRLMGDWEAYLSGKPGGWSVFFATLVLPRTRESVMSEATPARVASHKSDRVSGSRIPHKVLSDENVPSESRNGMRSTPTPNARYPGGADDVETICGSSTR